MIKKKNFDHSHDFKFASFFPSFFPSLICDQKEGLFLKWPDCVQNQSSRNHLQKLSLGSSEEKQE